MAEMEYHLQALKTIRQENSANPGNAAILTISNHIQELLLGAGAITREFWLICAHGVAQVSTILSFIYAL
jgi:hypothetical protein